MASILFVDDDRDSVTALAEYVRRHGGHDVRQAHDGAAALAAVMGAPPDVVVLDLKMPRMDGLAVVDVMRSYLRLRRVPVVLYSACIDELTEDRARQLAVRAVLPKVKNGPTEVLRVIESILPGEPPDADDGAAPAVYH